MSKQNIVKFQQTFQSGTWYGSSLFLRSYFLQENSGRNTPYILREAGGGPPPTSLLHLQTCLSLHWCSSSYTCVGDKHLSLLDYLGVHPNMSTGNCCP